jgi:hypothetical protein
MGKTCFCTISSRPALGPTDPKDFILGEQLAWSYISSSIYAFMEWALLNTGATKS